MGLDYVELIIAIEARFGIRIEDDEASAIGTAGQLHELVCGKVGEVPEPAPVCYPAAVVFYELRRAARGDRRWVRPSTPLADIFPRWPRRSLWQAMKRRTRYRVPDLVTSGRAMLGWWVASTAAAFHWCRWMEPGASLSLCLVGGGIFGILLTLVALPATRRFPGNCRTLGELARLVLAANPLAFQPRAERPGPEEIWQELVRLIVRQVGVDESQIVPEASIVEDLGID